MRLPGIAAPAARDSGAAPGSWAPERTAREYLSKLLETRIVAIAAGSDARDRYRRRVAAALVPSREGAPPLWIERTLVQMGYARVAPVPGETACFGALLEAEELARKLTLGLWANPAYAVRSATERSALKARVGTLQLVEGRIRRVATRRTHVYLEFGEDWRRDTTAVIARRLLRETNGKERSLDHLEGRRVRVRGWIELRYGPSLDLAAFEAIEVLPE